MTQESADNRSMVDNKVLPVMREAVTTVQLVLFKVLRQNVHDRYVDQHDRYHTQLAGAVINNLFGTQPMDEGVVDFANRNRELVERELHELKDSVKDLVPIITDALRMKTICDNQEGIHSIGSLLMAKALGILQEERDLPMPSTFMLQVRTLASAHGLVEPMAPPPSPED